MKNVYTFGSDTENDTIQKFLQENNIKSVFLMNATDPGVFEDGGLEDIDVRLLPPILGHTPNGMQYYRYDNTLDRKLISSSLEYRFALEELMKTIQAEPVAIVCTCNNPLTCQRISSLGQEIVKKSIPIQHGITAKDGKGLAFYSQAQRESSIISAAGLAYLPKTPDAVESAIEILSLRELRGLSASGKKIKVAQKSYMPLKTDELAALESQKSSGSELPSLAFVLDGKAPEETKELLGRIVKDIEEKSTYHFRVPYTPKEGQTSQQNTIKNETKIVYPEFDALDREGALYTSALANRIAYLAIPEDRHRQSVFSSDFMRLFARRSIKQVLGVDLCSPVECLLHDGKENAYGTVSGYASIAVSLARSLGIPTYNIEASGAHGIDGLRKYAASYAPMPQDIRSSIYSRMVGMGILSRAEAEERIQGPLPLSEKGMPLEPLFFAENKIEHLAQRVIDLDAAAILSLPLDVQDAQTHEQNQTKSITLSPEKELYDFLLNRLQTGIEPDTTIEQHIAYGIKHQLIGEKRNRALIKATNKWIEMYNDLVTGITIPIPRFANQTKLSPSDYQKAFDYVVKIPGIFVTYKENKGNWYPVVFGATRQSFLLAKEKIAEYLDSLRKERETTTNEQEVQKRINDRNKLASTSDPTGLDRVALALGLRFARPYSNAHGERIFPDIPTTVPDALKVLSRVMKKKITLHNLGENIGSIAVAGPTKYNTDIGSLSDADGLMLSLFNNNRSSTEEEEDGKNVWDHLDDIRTEAFSPGVGVSPLLAHLKIGMYHISEQNAYDERNGDERNVQILESFPQNTRIVAGLLKHSKNAVDHDLLLKKLSQSQRYKALGVFTGQTNPLNVLREFLSKDAYDAYIEKTGIGESDKQFYLAHLLGIESRELFGSETLNNLASATNDQEVDTIIQNAQLNDSLKTVALIFAAQQRLSSLFENMAEQGDTNFNSPQTFAQALFSRYKENNLLREMLPPLAIREGFALQQEPTNHKQNKAFIKSIRTQKDFDTYVAPLSSEEKHALGQSLGYIIAHKIPLFGVLGDWSILDLRHNLNKDKIATLCLQYLPEQSADRIGKLCLNPTYSKKSEKNYYALISEIQSLHLTDEKALQLLHEMENEPKDSTHVTQQAKLIYAYAFEKNLLAVRASERSENFTWGGIDKNNDASLVKSASGNLEYLYMLCHVQNKKSQYDSVRAITRTDIVKTLRNEMLLKHPEIDGDETLDKNISLMHALQSGIEGKAAFATIENEDDEILTPLLPLAAQIGDNTTKTIVPLVLLRDLFIKHYEHDEEKQEVAAFNKSRSGTYAFDLIAGMLTEAQYTFRQIPLSEYPRNGIVGEVSYLPEQLALVRHPDHALDVDDMGITTNHMQPTAFTEHQQYMAPLIPPNGRLHFSVLKHLPGDYVVGMHYGSGLKIAVPAQSIGNASDFTAIIKSEKGQERGVSGLFGLSIDSIIPIDERDIPSVVSDVLLRYHIKQALPDTMKTKFYAAHDVVLSTFNASLVGTMGACAYYVADRPGLDGKYAVIEVSSVPTQPKDLGLFENKYTTPSSLGPIGSYVEFIVNKTPQIEQETRPGTRKDGYMTSPAPTHDVTTPSVYNAYDARQSKLTIADASSPGAHVVVVGNLGELGGYKTLPLIDDNDDDETRSNIVSKPFSILCQEALSDISDDRDDRNVETPPLTYIGRDDTGQGKGEILVFEKDNGKANGIAAFYTFSESVEDLSDDLVPGETYILSHDKTQWQIRNNGDLPMRSIRSVPGRLYERTA